AQGGAGEMVDVAEADEELRGGGVVDDGADLLLDGLDVGLVEDVAVHEFDERDAGAEGGHAEPRFARHGADPPRNPAWWLAPGAALYGVGRKKGRREDPTPLRGGEADPGEGQRPSWSSR